MSNLHDPVWAHRARSVFQTLGAVWGLLFVLSFVAQWAFGWFVDRDEVPAWLLVATTVFIACWWGSGLVWLAGKAVGGYREEG